MAFIPNLYGQRSGKNAYLSDEEIASKEKARFLREKEIADRRMTWQMDC